MRFFNLHLPGDVRVFAVPAQGIRRLDEGAVVFDVAVSHERVLRHYSFPDRWFEVNCTLDRSARPVEEGTHVRSAFNCDICTPHLREGDGLYNVDLKLDVLVSGNGRRSWVKDEEDFLDAVRRGWLDLRERRGALVGLADLTRLLTRNELLPFLQGVCRFTPFASDAVQPPPAHLRLEAVPLLATRQRRESAPSPRRTVENPKEASDAPDPRSGR